MTKHFVGRLLASKPISALTRLVQGPTKFIVGGLLLAAVVGLVWWGWSGLVGSDPGQDSCSSQPSFQPVLPAATSIDQLGGWKALCPPESDPSYVYEHHIQDVAISVTEQPLPDSLIDDTPQQLEKLAQDAHYTNRYEASDGTVFYVGTSAKGPQSVMLVKHDLLLLIKSSDRIDDSAWQDYIGELD